jgi:hypothetical protein
LEPVKRNALSPLISLLCPYDLELLPQEKAVIDFKICFLLPENVVGLIVRPRENPQPHLDIISGLVGKFFL